MTDTTTPTTPVGTTTPVTPSSDDLQINLEENTPTSEGQPSTSDLLPSTEVNLDLDLNLPEAPKNDDRLTNEEEKNQEPTPSTKEIPENTKEPLEETTTPKIEELFAETPKNETSPTNTTEETIENTQTENKNTTNPFVPKTEMPDIPTIEETQPSNTIEEVITTPNETAKEEIIEPNTLQEDMNIIDKLQSQASTGGLADEANIAITPKPTPETTTFDLDAMLGTPPPAVEQATETPEVTPNTTAGQLEVGNLGPASMIAPAFTIPTTNETPIQATIQTSIPQKKTTNIKTFLFVMLFVALGFTTYFILQTMYPIELGNIFSKQTNEQMHGSEIETIENINEEIEEESNSMEAGTGGHESAPEFGELEELLETTNDTKEEQTDLSRLADYVNEGKRYRDMGTQTNNIITIKYGQYIHKKALEYLDKIAKGEKIDTLSSDFAQRDIYIQKIETAISTENTTPTPEKIPEDASSGEENVYENIQNIPPPTNNELIAE